MLSLTMQTKQYSIPAINLPLTCIFLTEWILVRLQGKDIIQYAHNQFTCNIKDLNKHQYTFSAHCNPHGKTISNMYIFYLTNQEIAFIQRKNICTKQIAAMNKYAIFSKITIIPDYTTQLIGIAGKHARTYLSTFFSILPNTTNTIIHTPDATVLHFDKPIERFLLIIKKQSILDHLLNQSIFKIQINNNYQWITLDIEARYPWIEYVTSEIFIPQAINMDILQGISFNKGCYIGQESIARIQYHGGSKKILFQLINTILDISKNNQLPKSGERLKLKIKNTKEIYIGVILQTSQITENNIWIQVVLDKLILKHNKQQLILKTTQTNDIFTLCT